MSSNHSQDSDTSAAYLGLVGGAIFIGAILYGIVLLTNKHYEGEKAEGKKAALTPAAQTYRVG